MWGILGHEEWDRESIIRWLKAQISFGIKAIVFSSITFYLMQSGFSPATQPDVEIAETGATPDGDYKIRLENIGRQQATNLQVRVNRSDYWVDSKYADSIAPGEDAPLYFDLRPITKERVENNHTLKIKNENVYDDMCNSMQNLTEGRLSKEGQTHFEESSSLEYNYSGHILWNGTVVAFWSPNLEVESQAVATKFNITVENEDGVKMDSKQIYLPNSFAADNDDDGVRIPGLITVEKNLHKCKISK